MWHGALHVLDENGMRFTGPIPPRDPETFRIMIVGDSLTYGQGIEPEFGYPKVLERKLRAAGYAVETVNLGVPGFQSADVRVVVERFYEDLAPDLVVYGICQNDFLNSGEGQREVALMRLPAFLTTRSKLAFVLEDRINAAARMLGASADFFEDILKDIRRYEARFEGDLAAMNAFVRGRGGPPIVAMVLDQYPDWNGRGRRLTRMAEAAARRAGMDVIATEPYYRKYNGHQFAVSPWEGHPNEWANEIFALMLYRHLVGCCGMGRFKHPQ